MKTIFVLLCFIYFGEATIELVNGTYSKDHLGLLTFANLPNQYYFSNDYASFYEASHFCLMYGMDLVKLESRFESDTLLAHINTLGEQKMLFYISANKVSSGQWVWIDGTPLSFLAWGPSDPQFPDSDFCIVIKRNYGWTDTACTFSTDWPAFFICETR